MSPEDCQNMGNTMQQVADGVGIVKNAVAESIDKVVRDKLRMFTDSHNYWNDFINKVNYPCPVRVQKNHFRLNNNNKLL